VIPRTMKTFIDIRVSEKWALREYGQSLGEPLGDPGRPAYVRRIVLEAGDPRLADLRRRLERDNKKPAILIDREYTAGELCRAELFQLIITDCFHPEVSGEDFGTVYQDEDACPKCGAGRLQRSPLRLDLALAGKEVDIVRTIALNEVIVSQRLAEVLWQNAITGCELREVEHVGQRKPSARWYQLNVTANAGQTIAPTLFGIDFFRQDADGAYSCPTHQLSGLHVLSEVYVSRRNAQGTDIAATSNRVGLRSGVLSPVPILLVSPRFRKICADNWIAGCKVEIAHLMD
jgi:hypothetical protein